MFFSNLINLLKNLPFKNLDLLAVGISVAAIGIMGFVIFLSNRKSITNRTFLFLSISASLWGIVNYISYQTNNYIDITLWLLRLVLFLAVWFAYYLFKFTYVFPENKKNLPQLYKFGLIPLVFITSIFTLTPYIFPKIAEVSSVGFVSKTEVLPGIYFFGIVASSLIFGSFYNLISKTLKAKQKEKSKYILILLGTIITFSLIITFNLVVAGIFLNVKYIPFGALFIFPFIAFTGYAIYKHKLFDLKSTAVAGLTFALSIVSFSEIIFADDISSVIYRSSVFMIVLIISFLMNKFVHTVSEQREQLQIVNEQQTNLVNFITHQVKGFFTKSKYIFSALLEGDYGRLEDKMEMVVKEGLRSDNDGIDMVQNILSAANIKKGTMAYAMSPMNLRDVVIDVVSEQKKNAEAKGLSFDTDIREGDYNISGDSFQLKNVIKNLIENSIKYTPQGGIKVALSKSDGRILFSVKDTGVGLAKDDKQKLFTEGGKGKNSQKVNVDSTGFGLFIAKNIVEAHTGKIWAESEGEGKGSEFFVEVATRK